MATNLSVKNVPEELVEALRARARREGRSLNKELLITLQRSVMGEQPLTVAEVRARVTAYGVRTADDATALVREERDGR